MQRLHDLEAELAAFEQKTVRAVTAEQVRDAAQKWLDKKRSVTGYLIKDTAPKREEKRS